MDSNHTCCLGLISESFPRFGLCKVHFLSIKNSWILNAPFSSNIQSQLSRIKIFVKWLTNFPLICLSKSINHIIKKKQYLLQNWLIESSKKINRFQFGRKFCPIYQMRSSFHGKSKKFPSHTIFSWIIYLKGCT